MFSPSDEAMPPKGLPGVSEAKYLPACGGAPHASDATSTNLVRARGQVERHCHISNIARRAFHNNHVLISRFTEQGQVRGVRLEGYYSSTVVTAGAAPYVL